MVDEEKRQLRAECLRLAMNCGSATADEVIKNAKSFYDFIEPEAPVAKADAG